MKLMIIVGARPNFMKVAPLVTAIREHNAKAEDVRSEDPGVSVVELLLVHTGQHYDKAMSDSFFSDLELPTPDVHLEVGSGSHAVQTAEIMKRFEPVLMEHRPDALLVVGDVNSTVACALVASKITYESGSRPLVIHVEAGLRSLDRGMPEEINRIMTDHLSDMLFVTEESGIRNLRNEGVAGEKIHFVGNTMIDSLLVSQQKADNSNVFAELGVQKDTKGAPQKYALLTLHRPSNVDNRETFLSILDGLEDLAESMPIFFSTHPRTRKRIAEFGLEPFFEVGESAACVGAGALKKGIHVLDPLGYIDFLCLMKHAAIVVTDSGGIQEETTCLGIPCVTVRENTERPVTVTCGTNMIAGTSSSNIQRAIKFQTEKRDKGRVPEKWDGKAGKRIIEILAAEVGRRTPVAAAL